MCQWVSWTACHLQGRRLPGSMTFGSTLSSRCGMRRPALVPHLAPQGNLSSIQTLDCEWHPTRLWQLKASTLGVKALLYTESYLEVRLL